MVDSNELLDDFYLPVAETAPSLLRLAELGSGEAKALHNAKHRGRVAMPAGGDRARGEQSFG